MRKCIQTKQNTSISHQYSLNLEMLMVLFLLKPDYYNLKKRTENSFSLIRKSALKRESRNSSRSHIFPSHSHNLKYRQQIQVPQVHLTLTIYFSPDHMHLPLTPSIWFWLHHIAQYFWLWHPEREGGGRGEVLGSIFAGCVLLAPQNSQFYLLCGQLKIPF